MVYFQNYHHAKNQAFPTKVMRWWQCMKCDYRRYLASEEPLVPQRTTGHPPPTPKAPPAEFLHSRSSPPASAATPTPPTMSPTESSQQEFGRHDALPAPICVQCATVTQPQWLLQPTEMSTSSAGAAPTLLITKWQGIFICRICCKTCIPTETDMLKFPLLPPIEEPPPNARSAMPLTMLNTVRVGMEKTRSNCQGRNLEGQPCNLKAALRRNGDDLTWFWGCTGYPRLCRATRDLKEQEIDQYLQDAPTVSVGPTTIKVSIESRSSPGKGVSGKGKGPDNSTQPSSITPMTEVQDPYESWWYHCPENGPREPKGKGKTMTKGNVRWRKEN